MAETSAGSSAVAPEHRSVSKHHPVRQYVQRVASKDIEDFPQFDLSKPLPKLPVPELSSTLQLYLEGIKAICPKEQYERTRKIVEEFQKQGGDGEVLQKKLKERAEAKDNWVYQLWLDDMYMNIKLPLPINSSVGMVFPRQRFEDQRDQLRFAAKFISGILDYKFVIDTKTLPVDRANSRVKGQPMCMEQYYRLFSSYRVPGIQKDVLISSTQNDVNKQPPEHIIVICKNQLFYMDLVVNFERLSDDNIYAQLRRIRAMAEEGAEEARSERVGILTAAERDRWARARIKLMDDSVNRESLNLLETCIFIVCLDDSIPLSFNHQTSIDETNMGYRDDVSLATQMLHGFGTKVNSCNRWFDKTMQFVICEDGACGLNYEHSPAEGIAVVQLIEHLLKYMEELKKRRLPRMQSICELPAPQKLRWHITDDMQEEIKHAMTVMDKTIETLDLYVLRFNEYGKEFPKQHNSSPDAFIQLAIQLTFYKIHKKLVSTYESASIRRFRLGRVDVIRACTQEALEWARAMVGEVDASMEEKTKLFRRALKKQTDILVQVITGHGTDNHLLGLRETAVELGMATPEIFADESYQMSMHFTVSTSQVPTSMDAFMCYGPVVPDGYGVCYNPHPNEMVVAITSFNSCGETRSDYFAFTLESSFMQMKELCEAEKLKATVASTGSQANGAVQMNGVMNNNEAKNGATNSGVSNGNAQENPYNGPRK